jgi:hypothetical protein
VVENLAARIGCGGGRTADVWGIFPSGSAQLDENIVTWRWLRGKISGLVGVFGAIK